MSIGQRIRLEKSRNREPRQRSGHESESLLEKRHRYQNPTLSSHFRLHRTDTPLHSCLKRMERGQVPTLGTWIREKHISENYPVAGGIGHWLSDVTHLGSPVCINS